MLTAKTSQNLLGTWTGTIDRGRRIYFDKKAGQDLFWRKNRDARRFLEKERGEDFFRKNRGEDFFREIRGAKTFLVHHFENPNSVEKKTLMM